MRILAIVTALVLAGCTPAARDHPGRWVFDAHCTGCHGGAAQGNGPLAAGLPVAPPDLTGLALRNEGVFPAEAVLIQIHGYPGRFHKGLMPEYGPVLGGPTVPWTGSDGTVTPTPQALVDLVTYLETVQRSEN